MDAPPRCIVFPHRGLQTSQKLSRASWPLRQARCMPRNRTNQCEFPGANFNRQFALLYELRKFSRIEQMNRYNCATQVRRQPLDKLYSSRCDHATCVVTCPRKTQATEAVKIQQKKIDEGQAHLALVRTIRNPQLRGQVHKTIGMKNQS